MRGVDNLTGHADRLEGFCTHAVLATCIVGRMLGSLKRHANVLVIRPFEELHIVSLNKVRQDRPVESSIATHLLRRQASELTASEVGE